MRSAFQESLLESLSLAPTPLVPRWFPTFPTATLHNPSRSASLHAASGYVSRRPVIARARERDFSSWEKVFLSNIQNRFWLRCILEYWADSRRRNWYLCLFRISVGRLEKSSLLFDCRQNLMLQRCCSVSRWIWLFDWNIVLEWGSAVLHLSKALRSSAPRRLYPLLHTSDF